MRSRPLSETARRIPIVLTGAILDSLVPAWRTSVLGIVELGAAGFFLNGVVLAVAGVPAPWFALAVVLAAAAARAADIGSWALFIPGGLTGRVDEAF
ncbi:MAG: hypothetical protein ABI652_04860, partial [Acidobacteriota bacterium]